MTRTPDNNSDTWCLAWRLLSWKEGGLAVVPGQEGPDFPSSGTQSPRSPFVFPTLISAPCTFSQQSSPEPQKRVEEKLGAQKKRSPDTGETHSSIATTAWQPRDGQRQQVVDVMLMFEPAACRQATKKTPRASSGVVDGLGWWASYETRLRLLARTNPWTTEDEVTTLQA